MSCVVKEWLPVAKVQEEYKKKLVTADEAVKVSKIRRLSIMAFLRALLLISIQHLPRERRNSRMLPSAQPCGVTPNHLQCCRQIQRQSISTTRAATLHRLKESAIKQATAGSCRFSSAKTQNSTRNADRPSTSRCCRSRRWTSPETSISDRR